MMADSPTKPERAESPLPASHGILAHLAQAIGSLFSNLTSPEVLKIPVIALCGVLSVAFLEHTQIASFKFGAEGVEVTRQDLQKVEDKSKVTVAGVDTNAKINGQLQADLNDARTRITVLEHSVVALTAAVQHGGASDPTNAAKKTLQDAIDKAAGGDVDTAPPSPILRPIGQHTSTLLAGAKGYVFLGNRGNDNGFDRAFIKTGSGSAVTQVSQIQQGEQYRTDGNMVLRSARPDPASLAYFRSVHALGTVPPNTLITVLPAEKGTSNPVDLKRGASDQVWAYVQIAQ